MGTATTPAAATDRAGTAAARVGRGAATVVVWGWGGLLVVALIAVVALRSAGWELATVDTGSMTPTLPRGSIAVVAPSDPAVLAAGDVVVFDHPRRDDVRVVHRIVAMDRAPDGTREFRTKGDVNPVTDLWVLQADDIAGMVRMRIPLGPLLARLLAPPWGWVALVLVPLAVGAVLELAAARHGRPRRTEPTA